jgi:hypothetical protein
VARRLRVENQRLCPGHYPPPRLRKHNEKNQASPISKAHIPTLMAGEQQTHKPQRNEWGGSQIDIK